MSGAASVRVGAAAARDSLVATRSERQVYASNFGSEFRDMPEGSANRPKVGFLFIGGAHHMLHLAPVAVELARQRFFAVHLFVGSREDKAALEQLLNRFGARMRIELLPTPPWARMITRLRRGWSALKLPRIYAGRRMLGAMDLLVTAERTSTMLKRLPGRAPLLVHIPHGAGDRAQGFEPRIRLFDHVIVAGPKDRSRMIAAGVVEPQACTVSGYIKVAAVMALRRRSQPPERLFANDRTTILYNPHFAPDLSSWSLFAERLARSVIAGTDNNLIVAPHVRLRERLSEGEQRRIEALAVDGRVIVDWGSERSTDMTYTLAADIYVGDVSSQVYEFLHRPRPCVFLNATGGERRSDPNFAFWNLGEVVDDPDDVAAALRRAASRHIEFEPLQIEAVGQALGPAGTPAVVNAAQTIAMLAGGVNERLIRAA